MTPATATATARGNAESLIRSSGLRPTRQRLAIVEVLGRQDRPVTAQVLHRKLPERDRAGLATIYRTLRALAESGMAQTFPGEGEGETAYRLCSPEHHHHLTCENCGAIVEIPSCEVEGWARAVSRRRGFVLTAHSTELFGLCERCRARLSAQTATSR